MSRLQFWLLFHQIVFLIRRRNYARMIVVSLFLLILLFLSISSFVLGEVFVKYMGSFGEFSKSFLYFTLLSLTATLSILSLISFTIAFLKTFFNQQLALFFLLPSPSYKLALSVFSITLIIGSWPYLLISLPFFFGMIKTSNVFFTGYLTVFVLHLVISLILGSLGGILAIVLFHIFGRKLTSFLPIVLVVSLIGLFLLFTKFIFPLNLEQVASQSEIWQIEHSLKTLPLALPYLPTSLFVESFLGNSLSVVMFLGEACLSLMAFILIARVFYRKAWMVNFEGYLLANSRKPYRTISIPRFSLNFFPKKIPFTQHQSLATGFVLIKKEILSFKRTVNAFIYLAFIIFLFSLFVFFLPRASGFHSQYRRFILVINLATFFVVSYLTLLFTIRFVFPTFTMERPFIWSVITSVGFRRRLSLFKWGFYQTIVLIFTITLGIIVLFYYKLSGVETNKLFLLFVGNAFATSTFALMIGQVFQKNLPKYDVENISTTIPGILVTIFSLMSGLTTAVLFFLFNILSLSWILTALAVVFLFFAYRFSYHCYKHSDL